MEQIQEKITEIGDDLQFAIQVALTYWSGEFCKDRADCGLPTYSLAYIREQQAKFELQHDLGVGIDREGEQFIYFLANIHALRWLFRVNSPQQPAPPAGDQGKENAGTEAEIITDKRKKLEDQLFEETLLPIILEKFEAGKHDKTSKMMLYNQIAKPYTFSGDAIKKRFEKEYKPKPEKLHEALRKYGNEELISQINKLR